MRYEQVYGRDKGPNRAYLRLAKVSLGLQMLSSSSAVRSITAGALEFANLAMKFIHVRMRVRGPGDQKPVQRFMIL